MKYWSFLVFVFHYFIWLQIFSWSWSSASLIPSAFAMNGRWNIESCSSRLFRSWKSFAKFSHIFANFSIFPKFWRKSNLCFCYKWGHLLNSHHVSSWHLQLKLIQCFEKLSHHWATQKANTHDLAAWCTSCSSAVIYQLKRKGITTTHELMRRASKHLYPFTLIT